MWVEVDGVEELTRFMGRMPRELRAALGEALRKAGERAYSVSRARVPVRTGRLRASIGLTKAGELKYRVRASAPYSRFVEFGTRRMKARPYMRPAREEALKFLGREVERRLRRLV